MIDRFKKETYKEKKIMSIRIFFIAAMIFSQTIILSLAQSGKPFTVTAYFFGGPENSVIRRSEATSSLRVGPAIFMLRR